MAILIVEACCVHNSLDSGSVYNPRGKSVWLSAAAQTNCRYFLLFITLSSLLLCITCVRLDGWNQFKIKSVTHKINEVCCFGVLWVSVVSEDKNTLDCSLQCTGQLKIIYNAPFFF